MGGIVTMGSVLITTEDARNKFQGSGLSYDILDEPKIRLLYKMLGEELKFFQKYEDDQKMEMTLSRKLDMFVSNEGKFQRAFMYVNGSYFKRREAISFNPGGFIGFGGWASSKNVQPMVRAFVKWCDKLGESKNAE